jgi:exopolysaccharide biosynthesis protein
MKTKTNRFRASVLLADKQIKQDQQAIKESWLETMSDDPHKATWIKAINNVTSYIKEDPDSFYYL